jgi:hypothetical protein
MFTIGEILRRGLLRNHKGEPYKHKATILKLIKEHTKVLKKKTPFGEGYSVSQAQIDSINARWH